MNISNIGINRFMFMDQEDTPTPPSDQGDLGIGSDIDLPIIDKPDNNSNTGSGGGGSNVSQSVDDLGDNDPNFGKRIGSGWGIYAGNTTRLGSDRNKNFYA